MKIIHRTREQVIRLWIKALRSGNYKQAKHALKTDEGFCCLGVLCDLAAKDGGDRWERRFGGYAYKNEGVVLPSSLERLLGPKIDVDALVELNDGGKSFTFIAAEIERMEKVP